MAYISATFLLFSLILASSSIIDDLNNLQPPQDFTTTISNNCLRNPFLKYCNFTSTDISGIFKSTIVASYLCNESKNPNCNEGFFEKIDLQSRPKITPLYLSFNFFWKYCPLTITLINLSNNSITGNFPSEILQCTQIQQLDLSHNKLTGDFPVQSFLTLKNLTNLNLSYNHFSEIKISDTQFFKQFNSSSFLHSGLLPDHQIFKIKIMVVLVVFPIFVIMTIVCFGWLCFWRPDYLPKFLQNRQKFTYSMIKAATNGFSELNLVAKIEELDIYRGNLRDGTEVRIDIYRVNISYEEGKKFVEECKVLVQLDHKNLIRVLGWCDNPKSRAIVTEWSDGVNIERWVSQFQPTWKERLRTLKGVVEGMCYLEEEWPEIVYDLKISSVLLSKDQEPLISRFGLGDINYNSRNIHEFGVFVLEVIANKRWNKESENEDRRSLIKLVEMNYRENVRKVMDERMRKTRGTSEEEKAIEKVIELGLMCTNDQQQPTLHQIYDKLTTLYECCLVSASPHHKKLHQHQLHLKTNGLY